MRRLRNAEHFDFYEIIYTHITWNVQLPSMLLASWNLFKEVFSRENIIYKRYVRQYDTRLVREAHAERRRSYVGLKLFVEAAAYNSTPAVKPAAKELLRVLANYPGIYRAPMTEASAMIRSLVQDLELPRYAALVSLVGVGQAVERFKQDNENFILRYTNRACNEEEEKLIGTLYNLRKETDRSFDNLAQAVNVVYRINEMQAEKDPETIETLSELIRFVNSYIRQYETIYTRRNPKFHPGRFRNGEEDLPTESLPAESL
jgi:hypothetical protein